VQPVVFVGPYNQGVDNPGTARILQFINYLRRAFRLLLKRQATPSEREVDFATLQGDLADSVAYELDVLEYLRSSLLGQTEAADAGMSLTLGDVGTGGQQRAEIHIQAVGALSEGPVRAALDRLRPLAFSAAFKLQDI